jgi:hypothetical protein
MTYASPIPSFSLGRLTLLFCMVMVPPLTSVWPFLGLINPLWSSFFGFPLHMSIDLIQHPYGYHPWYEVVLVVLWPFAALVGLIALARWLLEQRTVFSRLLVGVWLVSLFFLVPFSSTGPYVGWPLYAVD